MFSRLIGSAIIVAVLYTMLVFVAPELADQYGDKAFNAKIREYKDKSLQFASGSESPTSLFEKIKNTTNTYIDATGNETKGLEQTLNTKVNQAKEAGIAVEKAYSGVIDAKVKIQNLTGSGK